MVTQIKHTTIGKKIYVNEIGEAIVLGIDTGKCVELLQINTGEIIKINKRNKHFKNIPLENDIYIDIFF